MKKTSIILALVFSINSAYAKSNTEKAGDVLQILLPVTAYSATYALDDKIGRSQFYKSFLTNTAVTYALKYSVNRDRPENNGKYSFPSGHTSSAFQGATFIHKRYGLKYGIPAYAVATFIGWSRVDSKKHYTSDVLAGAAIGALSSAYFTTPYKNLSIKPLITSDNALGVNISYQW